MTAIAKKIRTLWKVPQSEVIFPGFQGKIKTEKSQLSFLFFRIFTGDVEGKNYLFFPLLRKVYFRENRSYDPFRIEEVSLEKEKWEEIKNSLERV